MCRYGWTLETIGSVIQNIIFTSSTNENGVSTKMFSGASRTLDTIGFYNCNSSKFQCDSVAVHFAKKIGDFENGNVPANSNIPIFKCDGIPKEIGDTIDFNRTRDARRLQDIRDYDTLFEFGIPLDRSKILCPSNLDCYTFVPENASDFEETNTEASAPTMPPPFDFPTPPSPPPSPGPYASFLASLSSYYSIDNSSFPPGSLRQLAIDSNYAYHAGLNYDGHYRLINFGQRQRSNGSTMIMAYINPSEDYGGDRVVRCSGVGCPRGSADCREHCRDLATASSYGLIQDWRLIFKDDKIHICVLNRPHMCLKNTYRIPSDGELSELGGTIAQDGVFILQNTETSLCLTRYNLSKEEGCNPMDDLQQWELNKNSRLEAAGNPYTCMTAYTHLLDQVSLLPCFPCGTGQSVLRQCTSDYHVEPLLVETNTNQSTLLEMIEDNNLIRVSIALLV